MRAKTGARLPRDGGGRESRPARRKRVEDELAANNRAALRWLGRWDASSDIWSKFGAVWREIGEALRRRIDASDPASATWSKFCHVWRAIGVFELSRPLDPLDPEDADKVVRSTRIDHEAEARAAMIIAEEYARVELAERAPAVTWFIQRLVQTPEDRGVLALLMKFLDRHHVSDLVRSWDAPEELFACHRDVHGHERRHLRAPKLTDGGARERVYERLRDEGIVTDLGRVERLANHVIAAAMGESLSAHRERQRAARKARQLGGDRSVAAEPCSAGPRWRGHGRARRPARCRTAGSPR
jgi:hypothetical protein